MSIPQQTLAILDVGHGNSAVIIYNEKVIVIDTGLGSSLLDYLKEKSVTTIDLVLISHADQDHIGGLTQLLSSKEFQIKAVKLNTDSMKGTRSWDDLLYELSKADNANEIDFAISLTKDESLNLEMRDLRLDVLAPSKYLAGKGPGSRDKQNRRLTSNSLSAVIRVLKSDIPIVLLPGDLDSVGLSDIVNSSEIDISAPIVVFPHHGGRVGSTDMAQFTNSFCKLVSPIIAVFSIGRGKHGTPRPEIIAALKDWEAKVQIMCTQLSERCAGSLSEETPDHLNDVFAQGRAKNQCCAGTILIDLDNPENILPNCEDHQSFIEISASDALCKS